MIEITRILILVSRNNNSRIDITCVCPELENLVQLCIHKTTPCPNHKAVLMSLEDKERKTGKRLLEIKC